MLWKAVKLAIFDETTLQDQLDAIEAIDQLAPFIKAWAEYRYTLFEKHPEVLRLLNWQLLEGENEKLTILEHPAHQVWTKKIQQFYETKQIDRTLPSKLIRMMINQAISGLFIYPQFGENSAIERKQQLSKVVEIVIKGISTTA